MKINNRQIKSILISSRKINWAARKAAKWINLNYDDKKPLILGLLVGSVPFYSKVFSKLTIECYSDFLHVSSYNDDRKAVKEPEINLFRSDIFLNKHIVIIEDIIDTGKTIVSVISALQKVGATSVKVISLLDKPSARVNNYNPDLTFFKISKEFVAGFGLDNKGLMRNLPYIVSLKDT